MPFLSDFFDVDPEAFKKRQEAYPSEGLNAILPEIADFVKTAKYYPNEPHPVNEPTAEEMAIGLGFAPQEAALDEKPRDLSAYNISNMGKKQELDYNASRGGQPAPVRSPSLQDILEEQRKKEGWTSVPGTSSFMEPGMPGKYRAETGETAEGRRATAAANSLRAFNKNKYGGTGSYGGGGAEALNPAESAAEFGRQAYKAGAPKRLEEAQRIAQLQDMLLGAVRSGNEGSSGYNQLESELQMLGPLAAGRQKAADTALMGSTGIASEALKPLEAMTEKAQQREEYGMLAQMLAGKPGAFPGGMNKPTYDALGKVLTANREERRLDNADRTYNRLLTNDQFKQNNPKAPTPSAAMVMLHAKSLLPPGTSIAKIAGQDVLVKSGTSNPVPNGDVIMKQAIQQAQQQLSQRPATNPVVTQNPGVKAVTQMLKAEEAGTLAPHQNILLQRFKTNFYAIKDELMSKHGMDENAAKEQAMILASGDVAGVR